MSSPRILLERHQGGRIAVVTVNRPEVRNALDLAAIDELGRAVEALAADPDLLAVVLTGAGEAAFIAGGDLQDLHSVDDLAKARRLSRSMGETLSRLAALEVPVIAAVRGFAFGGGCEVMVSCDYRVAGEGARIGFRQVSFGVMGGWGGTARLVRQVGRARALRLLLAGETVDGAEAHRIGLVEEVVPDGEVQGRALALAEQMASGAPLAVRATKRMVHLAEEMDHESALALEAELFASTWMSEDHREALDAFFAGRAPAWKGR
jgi:enoyl-CoA hydratase